MPIRRKRASEPREGSVFSRRGALEDTGDVAENTEEGQEEWR